MKTKVKITVMEPAVVNESSSKSVASEGIKPISSELTESEQSAVDALADTQYRFEKLRASLGVPKSMLGKADEITNEKPIEHFGDFDNREDGK